RRHGVAPEQAHVEIPACLISCCGSTGAFDLQFVFDGYVLDTSTRELRRGGSHIAIEPQVLDLLIYLVEHRERVVTKDDLIASIWGGRAVSDTALTSRIYAARKAIGDTGRDQKLIRTIARKGLRFIGTLANGISLPAVVPPPAAALAGLRRTPPP